MVNIERGMFRLLTKIRSVNPMMIPGKRKGSMTNARKMAFPGKFTLVIKNAPAVPITVEIVTAHNPTRIECKKAVRSASSCSSSRYHLKVNPSIPKIVLVGLNEKMSTIKSGK